MKTINVGLFFLELKLNTKDSTATEITHLFIFIKFIKKYSRKKQWKCRWEKMSKAIEDKKLTVTIKILLWEFNFYWKFRCTDKNNDKKKTNLPSLSFHSCSGSGEGKRVSLELGHSDKHSPTTQERKAPQRKKSPFFSPGNS